MTSIKAPRCEIAYQPSRSHMSPWWRQEKQASNSREFIEGELPMMMKSHAFGISSFTSRVSSKNFLFLIFREMTFVAFRPERKRRKNVCWTSARDGNYKISSSHTAHLIFTSDSVRIFSLSKLQLLIRAEDLLAFSTHFETINNGEASDGASERTNSIKLTGNSQISISDEIDEALFKLFASLVFGRENFFSFPPEWFNSSVLETSKIGKSLRPDLRRWI